MLPVSFSSRRIAAILVLAISTMLSVVGIFADSFVWELFWRSFYLTPYRISGNWTEVYLAIAIFVVTQLLLFYRDHWQLTMGRGLQNVGIGVLAVLIGWTGLFCHSLILEIRGIRIAASKIEAPKFPMPRAPLNWDQKIPTTHAKRLFCTADNGLKDCSDQQIIEGINQICQRINEITSQRSKDTQRSLNTGIPAEQSRDWAVNVANREFLSCCVKDAGLYRQAAIGRLGPGFKDAENDQMYVEDLMPWAYKALYIKHDLEELSAKLVARQPQTRTP